MLRTNRRKYIPVVLSRTEVDRVIRCLESPHDLVVKLYYEYGLRLFECLKLPVQDLNLDGSTTPARLQQAGASRRPAGAEVVKER